MRWAHILRLSCAALLVCNGVSKPTGLALQRRQQGSDAGTPTITSNNGGSPTSANTAVTQTDSNTDEPSSSAPSSTTDRPESSSLPTNDSSDHSTPTSHPISVSHAPTTKSSSAAHPIATNGTAAHRHVEQQLPVNPRITPALSIGGVFLILAGLALNLIGVKNKWVHISLSTGLLASVAVTVLINYVESPPVSNGIQGAYFVGIFMTGLIFGAGSLIFKEVTEGLGCVLGGFCVGMWFLTLKPGGLITNQTGKGIFIAVLCAIFWSFSFSHYTRDYGLIGSTAFSGATAFVIGVDCFSLAGYKEFWFYIWELNDNLFPLGTTTFPITKGIRVEIIVIVLATIIGVISQIKLWKIVRDKQKKKELAQQEDERRKDVVEQALGRQLERQNDKDRSNWEKQFGNTLQSKRDTILWSDAHPEQSYTHIPSLAKRSSSSESLELSTYSGKRQSRLKRQSSAPSVEVIPEEKEEQDARTSMERQKAWTALQDGQPAKDKEAAVIPNSVDEPPIVPLPFKIPVANDSSKARENIAEKTAKSPTLQEPKRASKRQSLQSMLSLSPRLSTENMQASESQEELMLPGFNPDRSRPSSIAATLDEEDDLTERDKLAAKAPPNPSNPKIVVSRALSPNELRQDSCEETTHGLDIPEASPSPPALSVCSDFEDPEELSRPVKPASRLAANTEEKRLSRETKGSSASEGGVKQSSDDYPQSTLSTGQTTTSEVLTKGALDQVPSQVSNVVMSYRTNEWAKHISTADAPVFDEPATIAETDDEAPTHLAPPSPAEPRTPSEQALDRSRTLTASSKPPAPHVIESNPSVSSPKESSVDTSAANETVAASTSRSTPAQQSRPSTSKGKRSSLGTSGMHAIDENTPTDFVVPQQGNRQAPLAMPQRMMSDPSVTTSKVTSSRAHTGQGTPIYALGRSGSYTHVTVSNPRLSRNSSVTGNSQAMRSESRLTGYENEPHRSLSMASNPAAFRSETRLGSYESRQPSKRDSKHEARKREQLLADWRISQQQGVATNILPKESVDARRAQMLLDKEHKKLVEDQQRAVQHQKQHQIEQVMRRPDMQDLHQKAMRKMQANAGAKP